MNDLSPLAEWVAARPVLWIVALVALQRVSELWLASANTRRLKAAGAVEVGAGHYPLFVALHASWLLAIVTTTPWTRQPVWELVGVFALMQFARFWVVASLGPYWTTRIITLPGAPLVKRGPFRFLRHPNYWVVSVEIFVLPLAFANWPVAVAWTILNALLLRHRIGVEEQALQGRRTIEPPPPCGEGAGGGGVDRMSAVERDRGIDGHHRVGTPTPTPPRKGEGL